MKKKFSLLLAIVLIFLTTSATFAETKIAKEIRKECDIDISDNSNANKIIDNSNYSKLTLKKGTEISVKCDMTMDSIYIIWDKPIGEWDLTVHDTNFKQGRNGYIHEYISLPSATKEFKITIPQDNAIICEIYVFDRGTTPTWVQKWSPPHEKADLLLLPTHGDDELIFFGGVISYYTVARGLNVQVAYMTSHWGEPYRPHEMLNALWTGGLKNYPVMGKFPDIYSTSLEHAKTVYNYDDIVDYNVELIRRFKPSVIVGHDLNGEYGHGGHMINAHALTEAVEISNDSTKCSFSAEQYGVWDVTKTYLHLYEKNKLYMNWDEPFEAFGGLSSYEMAVKSFDCHVSQKKWYSVKKEPGVYDCQDFGLYRSTVGEDVEKSDFFENIVFEKPQPPESSIVDSSSEIKSEISSAPEIQETQKSNISMIIIYGIAILIGVCAVIITIICYKNKRNRH